MKLKPVTVAIRRGENGYLNAYVVMGGQLGSNLLEGRSVAQVESAQQIVRQLLAADNIEVGNWEIDDLSHPPEPTQTVSTKRDSYGWRSMPSGSRFLGDPKDHRK